MTNCWWACHWCDWDAPARWWQPRWVATIAFWRHLRREHPDIDYAPWRWS